MFANRVAGPLFYSERGYIRAWYDCQDISIMDLASIFNATETQIRDVITANVVVSGEEVSKCRSQLLKAENAARFAEFCKHQSAGNSRQSASQVTRTPEEVAWAISYMENQEAGQPTNESSL